MQSRVPEPRESNMQSRFLGLVIFVLLVGAGGYFFITGGTGLLADLDTENSVAVTKDYAPNETVVTLRLTAKPESVDTVFVKTSLGTKRTLKAVGDTKQFVAINNSSLTVFSVRNGTTQEAQEVPIRKGFDPDVIVNQNDSGNHKSIQHGVTNTDPGNTVFIKKSTYLEPLNTPKSITIVGEFGTTVTEIDSPNATVHHITSD